MSEFELKPGDLVPSTPYRVIRLIGAGGMGSVYEVEHGELGKRFVLKALRRGLSGRKDLVYRIRNEWRALGRLEHPNIVGVTDAGATPAGHPYFVMERLVGETLGDRLRHGRPFQVLEALHVAVQILDGLHAAHGIGVVHRDVKPQNIFLCDGGAVKLLDFGIAKSREVSAQAIPITAQGVAIGTPRYMAPEQADGRHVDGRTDLYAVGLVLFEMLAGRGPFDEIKDPNRLFLAHVGTPAPRVSFFATGVPPDLDSLVAAVLSKQPERRPRSAAWMAASLREIASRLAARPSAPPLPEWIHMGPTVPGAPLEGAADAPAEGLVTRTLILADGASERPPGTTHDGARPGGQAPLPSRSQARPDHGDTQTMNPSAASARGFRDTVDGEEPETRTADQPAGGRDPTAPPVESTPSASSPASRRVRRRSLAGGLAIAGLSATIVAAFLAGQRARGAAQERPRGVELGAAGAEAPEPSSAPPVVIAPLVEPAEPGAVEPTRAPTAEAPEPTAPKRRVTSPSPPPAHRVSSARAVASTTPSQPGVADVSPAAPAPRPVPVSVRLPKPPPSPPPKSTTGLPSSGL